MSRTFRIFLPVDLIAFVDDYRRRRHWGRARVLRHAIKLLQVHDLECAYARASTDQEWETTAGDGLAEESG